MNDVVRASDKAPRCARRGLPWFGTALIAIIAAAAAFDVVRHHEIVVEHTGQELEAQARIIAEQTGGGVQAVDMALRHLADEFSRGRFAEYSPQQLRAHLEDHAVGLAQISGLALHDADGDAMAAAWLPQEAAVGIAGARAIQALRDEPASEIFIGSFTDRDGQPTLLLARRLQTSDGRFAGAVTARGQRGYFERLYRGIRLGDGAAIALLHRDGSLLARHADDLSVAAETDEQFSAVQPVLDYPLEVIVTRSAAAALAGWRGMAWGTAARTLALAAFAAALLWLLLRHVTRLEQTRADLVASRDRFALAAAGSNDGILDWQIADDRIFTSPRAREILGLAPGPDYQSRNAWFAALQLHPDDVPRRDADLQQHLAGTTPVFAGDYRARQPDGSYRWVRIRGVSVRDAAGKPVRLTGSVADIDAQHRAEASLRQSEERYALAMIGSDEGHWVWDIATDELFASPKLREIFRLPPDLPITMRTAYVAQLPIHPDDRARVMRAVDDHVAGRSPRYDIEYRIMVDGETRWVQARGQCFRDADGKPLTMAGSNVDITERKRTEEALRQSEQRYQLAIAGVNQGVWDWDLASDMVFMSPRAQRLLGEAAGEPLRPRRDWIARWYYHSEDRARVRQALSDYLRGATHNFEAEYRMRHGDGSWRWYHDRGVALRDEGGRPYRMAGSIEDITERKNAEAARDRLEAQLRQAGKLEAMGTLAGGIAHDFNNILAAILGYGEMAQKEAQQGTELRRHLDAVMSASFRAKALVERILAFSRSGMGERLPVHVQSVVSEVLDALAASAPPAVRIERELAADAAAVLGDPTQLHQVVMNLCTNAVQALGADGGTVVVAIDLLHIEQARPVTTNTLAPGSYVRLRVADDGSGIEPRLIDRIFDPFFTTKDVGVGTGLGLSLAHGIVSDLGGGIEVDSRLGAGSTFLVYLPRLAHAVIETQPSDEPVRRGDGETILLVDDETALVQLCEEMIAELGYEPVGFSSARVALDVFRTGPQQFDAVLTDEAMPGMTGSELAVEIRRIRSDIPIVVMSGYATAELVARARDAGVIDVLAKPLVAHDIARCLAAALASARASAMTTLDG